MKTFIYNVIGAAILACMVILIVEFWLSQPSSPLKPIPQSETVQAIPRNQDWEDGVFWGSAAMKQGVKPNEVLTTAYRLKYEAGERVEAEKKEIQEILKAKRND